MKKTLLKWYKSDSKIISALALVIMTVFMLAFLDLKAVKRTRDRLVSEGASNKPIRLYWDILIWYAIFGYDPSEYTTYNFNEKSAKKRLTFLSSNEQIFFSKSININANSLILDDKSHAFDYFKEYFNREHIIVNSIEDQNKFNLFSSKNQRFFYKPLKGSCGNDSGLADISVDNPNLLFSKFVLNGPYILEELINQCDEMASFNPTSVNTVRTTMIRTENGVSLLFGFIRCGRKGAMVDNGGAGGIIIPYDPENGKLVKFGFDECGKSYIKHPDSKIKFEGFQIPDWENIVKLSVKLTEMLTEFVYVGWDIAITDKGLVIVEGNSRPMFVGLQGMHTTGFKTDIRSILHTGAIPETFRLKQKDIMQ